MVIWFGLQWRLPAQHEIYSKLLLPLRYEDNHCCLTCQCLFMILEKQRGEKDKCQENKEKGNKLKGWAWKKNMDICSYLMHLYWKDIACYVIKIHINYIFFLFFFFPWEIYTGDWHLLLSPGSYQWILNSIHRLQFFGTRHGCAHMQACMSS